MMPALHPRTNVPESEATPIFSAARIAEIITPPGASVLLPTLEQASIIEQPLGCSVLVIAGAGSGKTETMANRVVWLVANGLALPSEVLGLTFTRKAAGELNTRIAGRLIAFAEQLVDFRSLGRLTGSEVERANALEELLSDGLDLPEVSTYNAFASGVVQEFGALAGVTAAATVIDEASAWRIAREIVCQSADPDLAEVDVSIGELVRRVLDLDHAVSDNLTTFDAVEAEALEFEAAAGWSFEDNPRKQPYAGVLKAVEAVRGTRLAARLAREFSDEKRRRGLIEFSDQLALAVQTLTRSPRAIEVLRRRSSVVLLDEVQDTSIGQSHLLSTLFRGSSVMAVGDPHQSIYGFRGASASNLLTFHRDFSNASASHGRDTERVGTDRDAYQSDGNGRTLTLSVSWRNPTEVLAVANTISAPLAEKLSHGESTGLSALTVPVLESREQYLARRAIPATSPAPTWSHDARLNDVVPSGAQPIDAEAGQKEYGGRRVEFRFPETVDEELHELAEWLAEARAEHHARTGELPTAAAVFRNRARMPAVQAALHEAGVPSRIVGVGGLLSTPEVTDLVSVLRCLWYADAGGELIRVLAGPRYRIGAKDLRGLGESARWFASRDSEMRPVDAADQRVGVLVDPDRQVTLLDALDEIAGMTNLERPSLASVSEIGRERLREAGRSLRRLRRGVGGDLLELIRAVEYELRLDIELEANESSGHDGAALARANLDAFSELVENFISTDERGTLASLLEWLERALVNDEAAEHVPEPAPGTVQIITAHGAKGLEWDLVVIPRLVEQEFPAASREGLGWLRAGQLPDSLRGDIAARPQLDWAWLAAQANQKVLVGALEAYQQELRERHSNEERRLAYVATTRAASRMLLTGSFWGGTKQPRLPSPFLLELAHSGATGTVTQAFAELPVESAHESDPKDRAGRTLVWPLEPLGARAGAVHAAADRVRTALAAREHEGRRATQKLDPTVELLLAEQRAQESRAQRHRVSGGPSGEAEAVRSTGSPPTEGLALGARLTASAFHEFVADPESAERRRLRPIPMRPYSRTRTGNLFHEWVERRTTTARGTALVLPGLDVGEFGRAVRETEQTDSDELMPFEGAPDIFGVADEADQARNGGLGVDAPADNDTLRVLIENFESSRWATRQPIEVELEISLPFAGRTLVCKLDAVYQSGEAGNERYEVVDWKSGRPPRDDAERTSRFLQLDLYRHAYASWAGIDPQRIDVTLFYVADGEELRGEGQRSLEELEQLWLEAAGKLDAV